MLTALVLCIYVVSWPQAPMMSEAYWPSQMN